MKHVMIDLETMSNLSNAAIVALGAVEFDLTEATLGRTFYTPIDLESSVEAGCMMDAGTVLWWLNQSEEARRVFAEESADLTSALEQFSDWLSKCNVPANKICIWGNGANFDNVILAHAYRQCGIEQPWLFINDRCYRTVKNLFHHIKMERSGIHHNALDDAVSQAKHLIAIASHANFEGE